MKKFIAIVAACCLSWAANMAQEPAQNSQSSPRPNSTPIHPTSAGHIVGIKGLAKVFADGLKTAAAVVQYDVPISNKGLSASNFETDLGLAITRVYANTEENLSDKGSDGNYVIVEFDTSEWLDIHEELPEKRMLESNRKGRKRPQPKQLDGPQDLKADISFRGNPPAHPSIMLSSRHGGQGVGFSLRQTTPLKTVSGTTLPVSDWVENEKNITLVLDGFSKPDFHDELTGSTQKFDLFVPYDYDPARQYPMVIYLHDEYACWNRHDEPLTQGLGPVIWAEPNEQLKHECFVLVPIFHRTLLTTSVAKEASLDVAMNLAEKVCQLYSIDRSRLYLVGQGAGASAAILLMEQHPHHFASALCLSAGWNAASSWNSLANENILFIAAQGDTSGAASVEDFIAKVQHAGAKVAQQEVSLNAKSKKINKRVMKLAATPGNIKYLKLVDGVVPQGVTDNEIHNKQFTWRRAYLIDPVKEWLFAPNK